MNNIKSTKKDLSPKQREELLNTLKGRFEKNLNRHKVLEWANVQSRLEANPERLWSLNKMERTGGEPDIVGQGQAAIILSAAITCSGEPVKLYLYFPALRVTCTWMVSRPLFFIRKRSCL
jgi:hypothetical protein